MTASALAPALISAAPLSAVMPPMATMGTLNVARAVASRARSARVAVGLLTEGKKLPKAT